MYQPTILTEELLGDIPRQTACRERYYRLNSRIQEIWDDERLKKLLDKMAYICRRLKLHYVHRNYLKKSIVTQRGRVKTEALKQQKREEDRRERVFGPNLRPDPRNVKEDEERLLQLIEIRAVEGITALIGQCEQKYSHAAQYGCTFPRHYSDILHVPRKLHQLTKTKIKETTK